MPVLGTVRDQEQHAGGGKTLHQAFEQNLGLGVDPVEVLEDDQDWLVPRLPQDQMLDRVQGSLAALRWIERLPLGVLDGYVEKRQDRRHRRLQRPVQGEELAGHLLPDLPVRVAGADPEIPLEKVDDRKVAGRLAVRYRAGLEDEAALDAMGVGQLEDEPRL